MRGRRLVVEWREDADELRRRYRAERIPEVRARLHGLWLVRAARTARATAAVLGVDDRTVQQWPAPGRAGAAGSPGGTRCGWACTGAPLRPGRRAGARSASGSSS